MTPFNFYVFFKLTFLALLQVLRGQKKPFVENAVQSFITHVLTVLAYLSRGWGVWGADMKFFIDGLKMVI